MTFASRVRGQAGSECQIRSTRLFSIGLLVAFPLLIAPQLAIAKAPEAIWVELVGPGAEASIRAIVAAEENCPLITADGESVPMRVRAEPGESRHGKFLVRSCELPAPKGKSSVTIEGSPLPLPRADPQRIVVFGDTGCRMKKWITPQDCSGDWDYPEIAKRAAESHPDLVIHLGDYLYRESCAGGPKVCKWPTGYDWAIWKDDFFDPAKPLLAAAPWIMVRGNHETCSRAGEGWFRFLDHASFSHTCLPIEPISIVELGNLGLVIIDSAEIAEEDSRIFSAPLDEVVTRLGAFVTEVEPTIPPSSWMLTHVPFYAILSSGAVVLDPIQQKLIGKQLSSNIQMIVSGHIHMFEALSFDDVHSQRLPQLVVGTGGTRLDRQPGEPLNANAFVVAHMGYLVWDRSELGWDGVLHDKSGNAIAHCRLIGRELSCR